MKKIHRLSKQIWYFDNIPFYLKLLLPILFFLSYSYRFIVSIRNFLYDLGAMKQNKLPCKVISIGNITVGGTGKTPMTIMLASILKNKGYKPAVLSRGYGGKAQSKINMVSDGSSIAMEYTEVGDEPVLIAQSVPGVPVFTGPERFQTGMVAVDKIGADILILDDAFQHRKLYRDIDIVLLNGVNPFGNGFLLPRGPLREHPKGLKRADIIILKNGECVTAPQGYCKNWSNTPLFCGRLKPKNIICAKTKEIYPLDYIRGKNILAFAGIASPESFAKSIEEAGGQVVCFLSFPDHYPFKKEDIYDMVNKSNSFKVDVILTTEKDAIRLKNFPDFFKKLYFLKVEMEISPNMDAFESLINERLK